VRRIPDEFGHPRSLEVQALLPERVSRLADVLAQLVDPPLFDAHLVPVVEVLDRILGVRQRGSNHNPLKPSPMMVTPPKRSTVSDNHASNLAGAWTTPVAFSVRGIRMLKTTRSGIAM